MEHQKGAILQWLLVVLSFGVLGFVIGYGMVLGWKISWGVVLDHGDSGPEWVNTVSDCLLILGFMISFGIGLIYLPYRERKNGSSG